jgi:hypothetical protein
VQDLRQKKNLKQNDWGMVQLEKHLPCTHKFNHLYCKKGRGGEGERGGGGREGEEREGGQDLEEEGRGREGKGGEERRGKEKES